MRDQRIHAEYPVRRRIQGKPEKLTDDEKPQTVGERYAIGVQRIGQWIPLILKSIEKTRLAFWL